MTGTGPKLQLSGLRVTYRDAPVVKGLDLTVPSGTIYALIGPAGSGKTSVLRTINLLSIDVDHASVEGRVLIDGADVLHTEVDRAKLRRRVGMVFAVPQPLPGSIYYNHNQILRSQ